MSKSNKRSRNYYRAALGSALVGTSLLNLALPVLAEGTAAGTTIINEATGSYQDPDGTTFQTESNTVTVTVAEVAGITATPAGVNDLNAGSVETGDNLEFVFNVTNTGNAETNFILPNPANLITEGFTVGDIDSDSLAFKIENSSGIVLLADTDNSQSFGEYFVNSDGTITVYGISADDFIQVTIEGSATATNVSNPVSVTFGNTPPNDNSASTQNQPYTDNTNFNDLYTQDSDTTQSPANTNPVREASAFQTVPLAVQIDPLALATILKTATSAPGATTNGNDDIITYNLELRVASDSPDGRFFAEELEGTPIELDTTGDGASEGQVSRILVSDVIPDNTTLNNIPAPPAGWTIVYSTDDPSTTIPVVETGGTAATWSTATDFTDLQTQLSTRSLTLANVQRVGFILNTRLTEGSTVSGFTFDVITDGLPTTGGEVYNIAQVFGRTYDDPNIADSPIDQIIYDESGDQRPNNFTDTQEPPADDGSSFDPANDNGVADPDADGIDPGNNTGTGAFGENNLVVVGANPASSDFFIGPEGSPRAVGPNDINDDFTDKLAVINDNNTPTNTSDDFADPRTFTNTVENATTSSADNVVVEPIEPSEADTIGVAGSFGVDTDIPQGTTVRIAFGTRTALYTYNASNDWELTSSTTGGTADGTAQPISIDGFAPGAQNYTVTITLPNTVNPNPATPQPYPVPIAVFVDDGAANAEGGAFTGETVGDNVTINRIYTGGFITLLKEARILAEDGTERESFTTTPTVNPLPGEFIEYRITYENISSSSTGTGNVVLSAENFRIVEHGTNTPNTWAVTDANGNDPTVHQQDTSASNGTVYYYQDAGSVTFTNAVDPTQSPNSFTSLIGTTDPADNSTVDVYINDIGTVEPGDTGTFIFRRQVRELGDS